MKILIMIIFSFCYSPSSSLSSSYDFGYLIRLLTNENLPEDEPDFFQLISCYFPQIYDVKYLMKSCKNLKGGLQEVADFLRVRQKAKRKIKKEKDCTRVRDREKSES